MIIHILPSSKTSRKIRGFNKLYTICKQRTKFLKNIFSLQLFKPFTLFSSINNKIFLYSFNTLFSLKGNKFYSFAYFNNNKPFFLQRFQNVISSTSRNIRNTT